MSAPALRNLCPRCKEEARIAISGRLKIIQAEIRALQMEKELVEFKIRAMEAREFAPHQKETDT